MVEENEIKEVSEVKPGRSWTKVSVHTVWDEAHSRRLQEQESCGDRYEVKIRLGGYGFAVLKRLKEEFVEKKKRKKLSGKDKKRKEKTNEDS